jgi:hypothetical protein
MMSRLMGCDGVHGEREEGGWGIILLYQGLSVGIKQLEENPEKSQADILTSLAPYGCTDFAGELCLGSPVFV